MSDFTELQLREAIRKVSERIEPITITEVIGQLASTDDLVGAHSGLDGDMELLPENVTQDMRRHWLLAACAAAVIALGLILIGSDRESTLDTTDDPLPTTPTTEGGADTTGQASNSRKVDVAVRFVQALESGDPSLARRLTGPSPSSIRFSLWGDTLEEQFEFWEIAGASAELEGCSQLRNPDFFECVLQIDDKVSRIQGLDPLEVQASFVVRDGLLDVVVLDSPAMLDWAVEAWAPYAEWAATNRPGDFKTVYPRGFEGSAAPTDPEVKALVRDLIDSYVRAIGREQLTDPQP